jgi:hypothetical protein
MQKRRKRKPDQSRKRKRNSHEELTNSRIDGKSVYTNAHATKTFGLST